jgi:hypothetical protein
MCEMQKYLPLIIFNAQEHYIIHLVEEIEMCGPVHTRSMWMVESNLKSLKDLIRQRACPKGSMVDGYRVYQAMVYIGQYLSKLEANMNADCILDVNFINKFEGEHLLGKGRIRKVKGN